MRNWGKSGLAPQKLHPRTGNAGTRSSPNVAEDASRDFPGVRQGFSTFSLHPCGNWGSALPQGHIPIATQKRVDPDRCSWLGWHSLYRFAAGQESVYNPYTLAGCLYALVKPGAAALWSLDSLPRCWAETGTPKVLLRGLHARRLQSLPDWDRQDVRPLTRVSFDVSKPDLTALMLQAGYLALDAAIPPVLVFPNREVQAAFAESLMEWFTETAPTWLESSMFPRAQRAAQLQDALRRQDAVALRHVVASGLEAVPRIMYQFGDKHVRPHEPFYQALLYVLCQSLELPLAAELPAGLGRVDLALELPGRICLLELKVNHAPETALRQAFRNFYAAPYAPRALPVTVWGLQFNRDTCTLQACQAWDLGRFDARTGHWENEPYPISMAELHQWPAEERRAYMGQTPLRETPPTPQSDSLSGSRFPIS